MESQSVLVKDPNEEKLLISQCKEDLLFLNENIDRLMQELSPKIDQLRKIKAINKKQVKNYALYETQIQEWAQLFYIKPVMAKFKSAYVDHSLLESLTINVLKYPNFPVQFEKQMSKVTSLTSLLNLGKDLLSALDRLIEIAQKITQANKSALKRSELLATKKQGLLKLMHWQRNAAQHPISPYEASVSSASQSYCNMV